MRLFVTPIGASGSTPGSVARAVVAYLEGGAVDPAASLLLGAGTSSTAGGQAAGAVAYYADSMEGPGRWLGRGASALGLTGTVTREALSSVLTGRDPATGARLLTAQGSTRRGHLAVGTPERRAGAEWAYTVADAAKLLGVSKADVTGWIAEGDSQPGAADAYGWIHAIPDETGTRLIPEHQITRVERLLTATPDADRITAGGGDDDLLTVEQAAKLLNVSARYVRQVCANHERRQQAGPPPTARPGERTPALPCRRGERRGAFEIRRADLATFAASRTPQVARV